MIDKIQKSCFFSSIRLCTIVICVNLTSVGLAQDFSKDESGYQIPFGLVLGSFLLDRTVRGIAQNNQGKIGDTLFEIDRYYGDRNITAVSLLGLYGFSYILASEELRTTSEKAILSAVVTGVAVSGLKELFGRSRPYRGDGPLHFKPFAFKESRRSLPSGHASVTFAISTVFADAIDNSYWKTFWYGSALAVGGARIYKDNHWISDVVLGSFIGFIVAKKTSALLDDRKATPEFGMAFENEVLLIQYKINF